MPTNIRHIAHAAAALLICALLSACSAPRLGADNGKFQACPAAPHCVSSTENNSEKYIAPISVKSQDDWQRLQNLLLAMPRTELISRDTHYLHAVTSTAIMRYKDDVELLYTPSKNTVDVRSSSRIGYYDFEVNRERIETLRSEFQRSK
ncbi:DUF1499 domain-containing protein [uncultured Zhongshania sp.]|jgi:uncharacterized protein (DUF1499 family)|uniref:DUF1499 domain-containing protein n=1 Tax=uncultured Zhongshania sp. TaxID=1642288 RepID=UPI0025F50776|nr:DUF1499 domain-containing protein [uncultured Zhongshania sp.]